MVMRCRAKGVALRNLLAMCSERWGPFNAERQGALNPIHPTSNCVEGAKAHAPLEMGNCECLREEEEGRETEKGTLVGGVGK